MPPLTTVATATSVDDQKRYVPLCSCGWEGTKTTVSSDAYREKAHHERTHGSPASRTETR